MGWMKTRKELADEQRKKREKNFYMLWGSDDNSVEEMRRIHNHLPAPKRHLPGHAESYNPPAEYLFDKEEVCYLIKNITNSIQRCSLSRIHFQDKYIFFKRGTDLFL